jgi:hypothetical protein
MIDKYRASTVPAVSCNAESGFKVIAVLKTDHRSLTAILDLEKKCISVGLKVIVKDGRDCQNTVS